uniref:Uncharacterized protein n=1 Tax=mine drainage metagenome TaxID=410659 RepID=E6PXU2_9ZZZZ
MYPRLLANLACPARILMGCVLVASPWVSAVAQSVESEVRAASAKPVDSLTNTQAIRDRSEESKGIDSLTNTDPGTTAVHGPIVESPEFAQKYAAEKLKVWQQNLKLTDWQISWAFAHRCDLKPHTVGQIHWDKPSKSASILVLDPSDYRMPFNAMLDDMEMTVIHELFTSSSRPCLTVRPAAGARSRR